MQRKAAWSPARQVVSEESSRSRRVKEEGKAQPHPHKRDRECSTDPSDATTALNIAFVKVDKQLWELPRRARQYGRNTIAI
jgi:hypothetical protein